MNIVLGEGPVPCDVMIIGEAPGKNEQEQGRPFVGTAGKVLNEALRNAGLFRDEIYITNVYKFRPPNNRTPTKEEIAEHLPYLFEEFDKTNPKFILLLGNTALKSLINDKLNISSSRGIRLGNHPKLYFYATYHPAATIYDSSIKEDFFRDISTFGKIVKNRYTF